jgi:hypothetical protein
MILQPGYLNLFSDWLLAGRPGFDFRQRQEIILYFTASIPDLGASEPPLRWIQEAPSPEVKELGREADHSQSSTAEAKNAGATPRLPHTFS